MPKLLVKPTGRFTLSDPVTRDLVVPQRPTVVNSSAFISNRIAVDQITVIAKLKDEATDLEFLRYWRESDNKEDLATSSFLSAFAENAPVPESSAVTAKRGRK
jgi:hypothetical protein